MSINERAKNLVDNFSKEGALKVVYEIIEVIKDIEFNYCEDLLDEKNYYQEVKQEIEAL